MADFYPDDPKAVPHNLTTPSSYYKRQAWLAMLGLLLFVCLYLMLSAWFGYNSYRLFKDVVEGTDRQLFSAILGGINAFLAVFMLKALVFHQKVERGESTEITKEQEPILFEFIYKIADNAGAPRPHKVFLSNQVNASVSYDLSILNLIFPSRKNLDIGLGLINVLSISEFKAVLAHELGHFGQRSMLIGRWVYVSQRIASHLISQRDILDKFLNGLSSIDIRIAWVGWILSIIVWCIRALMETVFSIVILAERALSRQMEFHADLVAVSLTGSDAIVNALHRLRAADQALESAINFTNQQLQDKHAVPDIYVLQANDIRQKALALNTPGYGESPKIPTTNAAQFRVFKSQLALPPKMWMTHPSDFDREENAKRLYISHPPDDRSSWVLFADAAKTRKEMTELLIKTAKVEIEKTLTIEECLEKQNEEYQYSYLDPKYRGAYLGRSLYLSYPNVDAIYSENDAGNLEMFFRELYPESLSDDLENLQEITEELAMLTALKNKVLSAPAGIIRHRGRQVKRKDLPDLIKLVEREQTEIREKVEQHDRLCRSVHLGMAKQLSGNWDTYLKSIVKIIHYAEHSKADLDDAHEVMRHVFHIVIADGRVTTEEAEKLIIAGNEVYNVLRDIDKHNRELEPGPQILNQLKTEDWLSKLEEFKLGPADHQNLNRWLNVIDGWVIAAHNTLGDLHSAATEVLLKAEEQVADAYLNKTALTPAPIASKVPSDYRCRVRGDKRPKREKLSLWDRFHSADGTLATMARLAVASVIIIATLGIGDFVSTTTVVAYNGLEALTKVNINGKSLTLDPHSKGSLEVNAEDGFMLSAQSDDGELIEEFEAAIDKNRTYVYNVAGAGAVVEETVVYGSFSEREARLLGAPRWIITTADHILSEAPSSIRSYGSGGTRDILNIFSEESPDNILSMIESEKERNRLISNHVKWDDAESDNILYWMNLAAGLPNFRELIDKRLKKHPNELISLRALQEGVSEEEKSKICNDHKQLSENNPDNPDYYYLATRCMEDGPWQDDAFLAGMKRWPKHGWLAYASGFVYSKREKWDKAMQCFSNAISIEPALVSAISIEVERIRQLAHGSPSDVWVETDPYIEFVRLLEAGSDVNLITSPYYGYTLMDKGDLEKASNFSKNQDGDERNAVLRLIGASDGATSNMIKRARAMTPEEGINQHTIWSAIGLDIRAKSDWHRYDNRLDEILGGDTEKTLLFIEYLQAGKLDLAEKAISEMGIYLKAQLYCLGTVALETEAPARWKTYARDALFLNERPYFE